MARGIRQTYPGARHHVFNRAAARRAMFLDDRDRRTFLALLREVHERYGVTCHAFCLMGNHYHLVLYTPTGNLSEAMGFHASGYTRSFNRRHGRDGPLFRGRFRSTVVEDDAHLLQLVRYVHRNPDDIRPTVDRDDYPWSSQAVYLGLGRKPQWLETSLVLASAGGPASYRAFVAEPQPSDSSRAADDTPLGARRIGPPSDDAVLGFTNTSSVRSAVHRSRRKATSDPTYAAFVQRVGDMAEQQLRATKGAWHWRCRSGEGKGGWVRFGAQGGPTMEGTGMAPLTELSRSVAGKVVLVTGAASGMGRATAHLFADEGAHVAATDLGQDRVDAVVAEIDDAGLSGAGWVMDVADAGRVETVVGEIVDRFGRLDIVVNNAGISRFAPIDAPDYEDHWAISLEVLLTAQTRVIRAALPHLRQAEDGGRIVNIASTEGWGATRFGSPYTAAKHGVIGLTKSLAVELGRENITVNCICPGPINTGMTAEISDADKEVFAKRRTALGRYGVPEEVAHGTLNFCLPASRYMTGAVLPVDGGLLIKNA